MSGQMKTASHDRLAGRVGTAGFEFNGPHAGPLFCRTLTRTKGPHWQLSAIMDRQTLRQTSPASVDAPAGSVGRLTLSGCRRLLDRVQHPMAGDGVVERGAKMRSLAIIAGEMGVCLRDVGGRALQSREPIPLRHGQDLERGLRAVAATNGQIEDLGLAAVSRNL